MIVLCEPATTEETGLFIPWSVNTSLIASANAVQPAT